MCEAWVEGTCKYGDKCWFRHGTTKASLLTHILEEPGDANTPSRVCKYLATVLQPAEAGEAAVGKVLTLLQPKIADLQVEDLQAQKTADQADNEDCLLYTSPSPRDA